MRVAPIAAIYTNYRERRKPTHFKDKPPDYGIENNGITVRAECQTIAVCADAKQNRKEG